MFGSGFTVPAGMTSLFVPCTVTVSGTAASFGSPAYSGTVGVPFDIADPAGNDGRAAIVLYGTNRDFFPVETPEIAVGLQAETLYFLHGYGWDETPGTPVLTYRVRYADGETADFVCRARREIGPWHGAQVATEAKLAVEADNITLGKVNLQCARWTNPRPGVEIAGVTPISAKSAAVPAVVAITAER